MVHTLKMRTDNEGDKLDNNYSSITKTTLLIAIMVMNSNFALTQSRPTMFLASHVTKVTN